MTHNDPVEAPSSHFPGPAASETPQEAREVSMPNPDAAADGLTVEQARTELAQDAREVERGGGHGAGAAIPLAARAYAAITGSDESWGGCHEREAVERVLDLVHEYAERETLRLIGEHADLVKRAENAEAREARLRAGIEALHHPGDDGMFCVSDDYRWPCPMADLLATPDEAPHA